MMKAVKKMQSYFFDYRFEILGIILTWILFGGTLISSVIFHEILLPISIFILMGVSIIIVKNKQKTVRFVFIIVSVLMLLISLLSIFTENQSGLEITSLIVFLAFFALLSFEVFQQMLQEKTVTHNIIIAAFDCYLLLGIMGATLFTILLYFNPNAYSNIETSTHIFDKMLYFSFITLTSIGYGDISPLTPLAEKLTAFFGLIGHFYSVVVVGIIVGKYVAD